MWQRTEPKENALGSLNLYDCCYCEVAGPDGTGTKNENMLCTIHKVTKSLRELQLWSSRSWHRPKEVDKLLT